MSRSNTRLRRGIGGQKPALHPTQVGAKESEILMARQHSDITTSNTSATAGPSREEGQHNDPQMQSHAGIMRSETSGDNQSPLASGETRPTPLAQPFSHTSPHWSHWYTTASLQVSAAPGAAPNPGESPNSQGGLRPDPTADSASMLEDNNRLPVEPQMLLPSTSTGQQDPQQCVLQATLVIRGCSPQGVHAPLAQPGLCPKVGRAEIPPQTKRPDHAVPSSSQLAHTRPVPGEITGGGSQHQHGAGPTTPWSPRSALTADRALKGGRPQSAAEDCPQICRQDGTSSRSRRKRHRGPSHTPARPPPASPHLRGRVRLLCRRALLLHPGVLNTTGRLVFRRSGPQPLHSCRGTLPPNVESEMVLSRRNAELRPPDQQSLTQWQPSCWSA
ncbi:hypothetical protein NDU88_006191 [Pleurodeles waltl]|uniref:Uncharacterized protein n=1 Tax=Pleurodeles waltl TaxID=8319 RepID=A0AAV7LPS5_PLEWA|nr:hypothetical protein NDU88_006191 [Pleurodeles waltl]